MGVEPLSGQAASATQPPIPSGGYSFGGGWGVEPLSQFFILQPHGKNANMPLPPNVSLTSLATLLSV